MLKLLRYSIRNSYARKLTFTLTVLGIALVVFVFAAVLMLSHGLSQALVETGNENNAVALRQSASTEVVSIILRNMADIVRSDPAIATGPDGSPLFAGEIMVLINQRKRSDNEPSNVAVRGVDSISLAVRPQVHLVQGRMWRPGSSEVIAGIKTAATFEGCGMGETVRFGQRDWTVVGLFEAGGGSFESEIWGDISQFQDAFQRPIYSSLVFKLRDPSLLNEVKARLEADRRLTVEIMSEKEYYRRQSRSFSTFIGVLGTTISVVFALGAIVGAMITMYAAVANRTREIGTLRALGFSRPTIWTTFLTESAIISLVGGAIGIAAANLLSFLEVSTTNFDTFAEVAFSFRMSPEIAIKSLVFAIVMGFVGGFLPSVRASRLKILDALRAR
jgi:putative ABC transport system permease protein